MNFSFHITSSSSYISFLFRVYTDFITVKSLKNIKRGEEITICYAEVNPYLQVSERQLVTEEIFYFTCHCTFCKFEQDLVSIHEESKISKIIISRRLPWRRTRDVARVFSFDTTNLLKYVIH